MKLRKPELTRLVIVGFASVLIGGCYYSETLIGVLAPEDHWDSIVVPDSVAVRSHFTVAVYTENSGCISFNSTRVDIRGNVATITPYDTFKRPGRFGGCEAYLEWRKHEATIRFMKTGQATIIFRVRLRDEDREPRLLSRIVHVY